MNKMKKKNKNKGEEELNFHFHLCNWCRHIRPALPLSFSEKIPISGPTGPDWTRWQLKMKKMNNGATTEGES